MVMLTKIAVLTFLLSSSALAAPDCLPTGDAKQHVAETKCITGKVTRVKVGAKYRRMQKSVPPCDLHGGTAP
jgi:hypothetical protein